jgi:hypothetical protein
LEVLANPISGQGFSLIACSSPGHDIDQLAKDGGGDGHGPSQTLSADDVTIFESLTNKL